MKFRFTFILLLVFCLNISANSTDITGQTTSRTDGSKIDYYLIDHSTKNQSDTLLIVLQGSDCNSVLRIESIFSDLQHVWPKADLLLVEKYGINQELAYDVNAERKDCPSAYLKNDNPKQRVKDINTVLQAISKHRLYENFVVVGGSEGAVIANLLTAENSHIDATISFNGGARWFIDDVLHNIASEYEETEQAQESIEGFKGFSQHLLKSEPFELEMSGHGYEWWYQTISIDQLHTLQKIQTPLLLLQGGIDLSVSPAKVNEMVSMLRESGKENIDYRFYQTLDHGFKNVEGKKELDKVVIDMNNWLKAVLSNPKR